MLNFWRSFVANYQHMFSFSPIYLLIYSFIHSSIVEFMLFLIVSIYFSVKIIKGEVIQLITILDFLASGKAWIEIWLVDEYSTWKRHLDWNRNNIVTCFYSCNSVRTDILLIPCFSWTLTPSLWQPISDFQLEDSNFNLCLLNSTSSHVTCHEGGGGWGNKHPIRLTSSRFFFVLEMKK